jgi:dTDP-4-dehydrorhamnose reductase
VRNVALFFVFVSTDYVFDGEKGVHRETDNPAPINHYGLTKLKGEEAVQALDNYGIARGNVIYGSTPATGKVNFVLWLLDKPSKKEEVKIIIPFNLDPKYITRVQSKQIKWVARRPEIHH